MSSHGMAEVVKLKQENIFCLMFDFLLDSKNNKIMDMQYFIRTNCIHHQNIVLFKKEYFQHTIQTDMVKPKWR